MDPSAHSSPPARNVALLVSVHAYPDPAIGARRVSELASHLATRGWEVHLIAQAGPFPRSGGELSPAIRRHDVLFPTPLSAVLIRACRRLLGRSRADAAPPSMPKSPSTTHNPATPVRDWIRFHYFRITVAVDNYKRWSLRAGWLLTKLIRSQGPTIVFVSGPPFSPLPVACLVARLLRVRILVDMRDPWADRGNLASKEHVGFRRWLDNLLERSCISLATHVVTTSDRLTRQLRERYSRWADKITTIRNGYEDDKLMDPPRPSGRLSMLYAGTIYFNRNPFPFLQALAALISTGAVTANRVAVTFVGDCRHWQGTDIGDWLTANGLGSVVTLRDPVPSTAVPALIRDANVLINFAQNQKDSVPAKLFEQLASRRHVLLFAEKDSESALLADQCPQVIRVDSDLTEIQDAILMLYARLVLGADAVDTDGSSSIEDLSRRRANERFEHLIRTSPT